MLRKSLLILMVIAVCMVLFGCTELEPYESPGPAIYTLGTVWETDGNRITVTEAAAADSYQAPDGTEYRPNDGERFIVVRLDAVLAKTWIISTDTVITAELYASASYGLWCDPIFEGDECVLLFSVAGEEPEDFTLELYLTTGPDIRSRSILLREEP